MKLKIKMKFIYRYNLAKCREHEKSIVYQQNKAVLKYLALRMQSFSKRKDEAVGRKTLNQNLEETRWKCHLCAFFALWNGRGIFVVGVDTAGGCFLISLGCRDNSGFSWQAHPRQAETHCHLRLHGVSKHLTNADAVILVSRKDSNLIPHERVHLFSPSTF